MLIDLFSRKPIRKKIIVIIILVIVGYLCIDLLDFIDFFSSGLTTPLTVYQSNYGNYVIRHPESWTATDLPEGDHGDMDIITIIKPFRTWPSLVVASRTFTGGTLNQVTDWGEIRVRTLNHYAEVSRGVFNFPNTTGIVREYHWVLESMLLGDSTIYCTDYYLLHHDRGYILSFCSDQSQLEGAQRIFTEMIESFEFR